METIVKVFTDVRGNTFDTILDLLFTTERLLIIQILSPTDGRDLRVAPNLLSLFIGSAGIRRAEAVRRYQIASERREKLMRLNPNQIAQEEECVVEVPYALLSKVVFRRSLLERTVTFDFEKEGVKRSVSVRLTREQFEDMWKLLGDFAPYAREGRE
jgi:hypothetical protein